MRLRALLIAVAGWAAAIAGPACGQVMEAELRLTVQDPAGRPVAARIQLDGHQPEFHAAADADGNGAARLTRLPPGRYRLLVTCPGFEDFTDQVDLRSAVPQQRRVTLQIRALATEIVVRTGAPLLDPSQPGQVVHAGRRQLEETLGTTLGRSTIDVVSTMPGWLLEANAVLHPRGSEYDTQYVIDGMPLYDNRSLAFAPAFENSEFEAVSVLTAGIPAEYGRRLGGVIALDTRRTGQDGHRTEAAWQAGSYASYFGSLTHLYRTEAHALSLGVYGGGTDRYLDPPSLENFSNHGAATGVHGRWEQNVGLHDRLTFYFRSNRTGFLVPNDLLQQAAGQRQDRRNGEAAGQVHYQHLFSSRMLGSARGMVRELSSRLWSNPLATPLFAEQDRGLREAALVGSVTIEGERHTWKVGGDLRSSRLREQFRAAEPDALPDIAVDFRGRRLGVDASVFLQDHVRLGNFSALVGLRLDHHRLLIRDTAWSPRLAFSYYLPAAGLLLRAAYDRVFQPPPQENLLLSSGAGRLGLPQFQGVLDVPASRANFLEVGIRKPLGNLLRLDANHYWRTFRHYFDDDVFLNTGVSFPISFDTARIQGTELRLEMPRWRGVSSFASYANMKGAAASPVTGGLFLRGGEAEELRGAGARFPVSQDQRNTVAAQVRLEPHRRLWLIAGVRYGSGLPVELDEDDDEDDEDGHAPRSAIPPAIARRVNESRGRLRPNFSLDGGAGIRLWERDGRAVALQVDVRNATGRLNVINFTGLFSGTAIAPGRQVTVQMRFRL